MEINNSKLLVQLLTILFVCFGEINGATIDKDLSLTQKQKIALDAFREIVEPYLEKDYMKQDIYLIRWLRARNFNLRKAEEMLLEDLNWRANENMDTIEDEDWEDFQTEYPYYLDGYDKEGKPILTANFDEWDLRKGIVAGKFNKIMRWLTKAQENGVRRVRELQAEGKNVTQWDFIINTNNFNLVQHGCIQCLPLYTNFVSNYEKHFPGSCDKIILVNTPQVFDIILNLIRPVMSKQTRDAFKVYNNNKDEWGPILFADIDRDQLTKEYGGTKVRYD